MSPPESEQGVEPYSVGELEEKRKLLAVDPDWVTRARWLATIDNLQAQLEERELVLQAAERGLADAESIIEFRTGKDSWVGSLVLKQIRKALASNFGTGPEMVTQSLDSIDSLTERLEEAQEELIRRSETAVGEENERLTERLQEAERERVELRGVRDILDASLGEHVTRLQNVEEALREIAQWGHGERGMWWDGKRCAEVARQALTPTQPSGSVEGAAK